MFTLVGVSATCSRARTDHVCDQVGVRFLGRPWHEMRGDVYDKIVLFGAMRPGIMNMGMVVRAFGSLQAI